MKTYSIVCDGCILQAYASENRKDQAIIFLHGGPGSGAKAIFELSAFQALENDVQCVHFDQRGSGDSDYDLKKGLTIDQICNDVAKVVEDTITRFKPRQLFLWGGSYGGTLACLYMQTYARGIDGLILNNPAIFFDSTQAISFFTRLRNISIKRMPVEFYNEEKMKNNDNPVIPSVELQKKDFVEFVYSPYNPSNSLRHICAMSSWFFNQTYRISLELLQIPTLLLLGKEDPICRNVNTIQAVQEINNTNIQLRILSPCGHAIFEDRPEEFVAYTKAFLQQYFT